MQTRGSFLSNCNVKRHCFVQSFLVTDTGNWQAQSCGLGTKSFNFIRQHRTRTSSKDCWRGLCMKHAPCTSPVSNPLSLLGGSRLAGWTGDRDFCHGNWRGRYWWPWRNFPWYWNINRNRDSSPACDSKYPFLSYFPHTLSSINHGDCPPVRRLKHHFQGRLLN